MLQFEELRLSLEELKPDIDDLSEALGLDKIKEEIENLEAQASKPSFWDDMQTSQKVLQRTSMLKSRLNDYKKLVASYEDAMALI